MKQRIRLTESQLNRVIKESVRSILTEDREVVNPKFRQLMKCAGLGDIRLIKGAGYFYLTSDNEDWWNIINQLNDTSIYVYSFNQYSPEEWLELIQDKLNDIEY